MSVTAVEQKQLFINDEWRDVVAGKTMDVINPATEEVCATSPRRTPTTWTRPSTRRGRR